MVPSKEEKRKQTRREVNDGFIEIPLTYPKGIIVREKILDISPYGLSFKIPQTKGYFLPRTPIRDFHVYVDGQKTLKSYAEVAYTLQIPDNGEKAYKIGIAYIQTSEDSIISNKRFRAQRYNLQDINIKGSAWLSINNNIVKVKLVNLSGFGAALELIEKDVVFRVSETIDHLELQLGEEVIYEGTSTVTSVREKGDKLIIGVLLKDSWIDIETIEGLKKREILKQDIASILDESRLRNIDTQFKVEIADLRYMLEEIKKKMDEEEKHLQSQTLKEKKIEEKYILNVTKEIICQKIDRSLLSINQLYLNFSDEQKDFHRVYFQKQLHQLIRQASFIDRVYSKPLGYAGDFEMMNMIYKNKAEGDSLFAKLLNMHTLQISPARSNRNRIRFLYNQVEEVVENSSNEETNIASIASGPAIELQMFLKNSSLSSKCNITLIDFEKEALHFSHQRLWKLKTAFKRDTKLRFFEFPIAELVNELRKRSSVVIEKQDLIYCAGLFEYLTDGFCTLLIKILLKKLNPGGRLIVGNFDPSNPYRAYMELGGEWYLIYRTKNQMVDLVKDISVADCYCKSEELGINNFLIVDK